MNVEGWKWHEKEEEEEHEGLKRSSITYPPDDLLGVEVAELVELLLRDGRQDGLHRPRRVRLQRRQRSAVHQRVGDAGHPLQGTGGCGQLV